MMPDPVLEAMEKEIRDKKEAALERSTVSKQNATHKEYKAFAENLGYYGPLHRAPLALFLEAKCKKAGNTASHGTWKTNVIRAETRETGKQVNLGDGAGLYFFEEKKRLAKKFGLITHRVVEWGKVELAAIAIRCKRLLETDIHLYAIFAQACIAYATLLRPEEQAGYNFQVCLGDVTIIPADEGLPYGGIQFLLGSMNERKAKGMLLSGSEKGERVLAAGTGCALCPVAHIVNLARLYDLGRPTLAKEPLFAALHKNGARMSLPDGSGAPPIPRTMYANGLARLAAAAGIQKITPRGSRAGCLTDSLAEGAPKLPMLAHGRWRGEKVLLKAYCRASVVSLKGIVAAKKRAKNGSA
jgi:hypothetical protein